MLINMVELINKTVVFIEMLLKDSPDWDEVNRMIIRLILLFVTQVIMHWIKNEKAIYCFVMTIPLLILIFIIISFEANFQREIEAKEGSDGEELEEKKVFWIFMTLFSSLFI